jgi:hypothetical protein
MYDKMRSSQISFWLAILITFSLLTGLVQPVLASPSAAPNAPSSLTAKYYPLGIASLTWKDNSKDETQFVINMDFSCPSGIATVSGGVAFFAKANTTSANVQMQNGCKYKISIQAEGKNKDRSAKSNSDDLIAPPIPPESLAVKPVVDKNKKITSYNIAWKDKSDNEGIFAVAIGYKGGIKVFGFSKNATSAAIPAWAIPASAKYEWMASAIPASAIPASYKKPGDAIPASALNVLAIPSNSNVKYLTSTSYLPLILGSNVVTTSP